MFEVGQKACSGFCVLYHYCMCSSCNRRLVLHLVEVRVALLKLKKLAWVCMKMAAISSNKTQPFGACRVALCCGAIEVVSCKTPFE